MRGREERNRGIKVKQQHRMKASTRAYWSCNDFVSLSNLRGFTPLVYHALELFCYRQIPSPFFNAHVYAMIRTRARPGNGLRDARRGI